MSGNEAQVELWNGEATSAWTSHADRYDRQLEPFGREVLAAAGLDAGERVLDVGCGSGWTTREAGRAVGAGGTATGVDISAPLLHLARSRAADDGLANVDFVEADAQVHPFEPTTYDAVISRFGVMFFADPGAAFANLLAATAPGGRLVFACWQPVTENEWTLVPVSAVVPHVGAPQLPPPGSPGPFAFGDRDVVRSVLTDAGWADVAVEPYNTTVLVAGGGSVDDAVSFYVDDAFGRAVLGEATGEQREAAVASLRSALAEHLTPQGVRLSASVWIASAVRED